ncbi:MAG: hypothetical protein IPM97_15440 [Bdellovibrionaceae bacterium]|nr:hypothetical protein [Pseudobdellovibrionaceae bacterium]
MKYKWSFLLFVILFVSPGSFAQQAVIEEIINDGPAQLTSSDYETLFKAAGKQKFIFGPECSPQSTSISKKDVIPDVFGDRKFGQQYGTDPVFQRISLFLHFNKAAEIVPDDFIARFTDYAKAFYILYKNGLVQSPDLGRLTIDETASITEFFIDNRDVKFRRPRSAQERWAYRFVKTNDLRLPDQIGGPKRFSSAMIHMMAKIAQYETVCEMSVAETTALAIYIGMGFKHVNSYLRSKVNNDPVLNDLEELTNQALNKIADTKRLVFRTAMFLNQPDMPEAVYREHAVGNVIEHQAFTSTALNTIKGANFLIYSQTGKALGRLSIESEVLFRSKAKFLVRYNSCEEVHQSVWQGCRIILEEVNGH